MKDSAECLAAKLQARRDYYEWKATITEADRDAMYGPRDENGRRTVRIEFAK